MNEIEEVKARLDIVEIIGQSVQLQKAGRTFKAPCPFHQEKTPSFVVSPDRQSWHCFGACGTGGDVISFVMKREGLDFPDALRMLAERAGVKLPERGVSAEQDRARQRLIAANEAAAEYFQTLLRGESGKAALAYLEGRGVDAAAMHRFAIGYSAPGWEDTLDHLRSRGFTDKDVVGAGLALQGERRLHDRFRNRLMFAVWDAKGKIIGFGARGLDADAVPKYLNTAQTALFDKGGTLYALDKAQEAIRREGRAVVVEGYMDVIAAHQHGFENVVAQMGTALTDRQVKLLKRITGQVVLALDADAAGLDAAVRGHDVIREQDGSGVNWTGLVRHQESAAIELRVAVLPEGRDPDDVVRADPELWRTLIAEAEPVLDFRLNRAAEAHDLTDPRERSSLVDEFLPLLSVVEDKVVLGHYLDRLARYALTRVEDVADTLTKLKKPAAHRTGTAAAPNPNPIRTRSVSNPREDFLLALLLQYPELRPDGENIPEELLWESQSKLVLSIWKAAQDIESVKDAVPVELKSYLERLILWGLPISSEDAAAEALQNCVERLNERLLQAEKQAIAAQIAALQEETGPSATESTDEAVMPPTRSEELQQLLQRDMEIGRQLHTRGRKGGGTPVEIAIDG